MSRVRELLDESIMLYAKGDIEGVADLFAEDGVLTVAGIRYEGKDQIRGYWQQLARAFPDGTSEIGRSTESGDMLFAEVTSRGTNTGELVLPDGTTIPATGKPSVVPGMLFAQVRDGKLVEESIYYDSLSVLSQLGLMPGQ
jgi:steroid delta-isomerase-like uncharacterized protein